MVLCKKIIFLLCIFYCNILEAQPTHDKNGTSPIIDFLTTQKNFPKVQQAFAKKEDTIKKQCEAKNIKWPIKQIYLRSFKVDNILELWVKDSLGDKYKFYKQLKVCAGAGKLGPKRKEGDKQVPEGFYLVERFNPNSNYHLSLGVSYPNVSDKILADSVRPGGDIYIHGDCVSVGCLAINNEQIEELYIMSAIAREEGQEFIPVHIFPGKFTSPKSRDTIAKLAKDNPDYTSFLTAMRRVFYYFEKERELPAIFVNNRGQYVVDDVEIPIAGASKGLKIIAHKVKKYAANEIVINPETLAVYNGGNATYLQFLKNLTVELSAGLAANELKAVLQIEFVVNVDGTVSNVQLLRGGNEQMDEIIKTRLEQTPEWSPATYQGKKVATKLIQTLFIEATTAP
jgi:murein L,D-transpeptidase YafK